MAEKEVWIGSLGPALYEDDDIYEDGVTLRSFRGDQMYLEDAPITDNEASRKFETDVIESNVDSVASNLSEADSAVLSNSENISGADSKGVSSGSNADGVESEADSKDISQSTLISSALSEAVLVRDVENYADSPMVLTGGVVSEGSSVGTFKVTALTALLRATHSVTGVLTKVSLAEQDDQVIDAANITYFIMLDYNGGTPLIDLSTTQPYYGETDYTQIPLGKVMKDSSNNVHYISGGFRFQDGVNKLHRRAKTLRDHELASGSTLAYSGTNNFTSAAGVAYSGINRTPFALFNSGSTQFTYLRDDGSHVAWTESLSNVIDFAHYDDLDGTLGNVGVGRYGCHWVYRHIDDGDVYVVYGRGSYKLAEAEQASEPPKPDHLTDFGCLLGCIIAPQAGGSFTTIQMVTDTFFSGTSVADHNQLGSLQGGDTNEYYHMTSANHSNAILATSKIDSGVIRISLLESKVDSLHP